MSNEDFPERREAPDPELERLKVEAAEQVRAAGNDHSQRAESNVDAACGQITRRLGRYEAGSIELEGEIAAGILRFTTMGVLDGTAQSLVGRLVERLGKGGIGTVH
ncbi:MAG TPA: hypothetical protein VG102_00685 [Candidatus Paceibacterota bacterium]|nr:hypothetical protein [Candidatus Paceibacterota bacterium]